ncbi:M10 family metallopeptidase C-terminal domain-containing protein [Pseudomonas yamanorum]|nr:M10 family metallopeptidase C-terminal domain-containing protein [Pseudomonas yamanorum]
MTYIQHKVAWSGEQNPRKPSYTTDQAAEQLTRMGYRWKDRNLDGVTSISYEFFSPAKTAFNTPVGANAFTAHQKEQARRSMQSWADVANLSFDENRPGAEGQLLLGNDANTGHPAYASYPGIYLNGAQAWFASDGKSRPFNHGSYSRHLLAHEIGHTLGLAHPGKYNKGGSYDQHASYAEDTRAHSVMSYWWEGHRGHDHRKNQATHYPAGPMMDDISAVQKLYGANFKTRSNDTIYGFNSNTGRDFLSLKSSTDAPVFCVWDGGGNDTLDFSGFHQHQSINLNAKQFSDVGGMKGNVSIAKGVTLENAIAGSGDDQLMGNAADNRLTGGAGADRIRGGAGADTFVYDKAGDSTESRPDLLLDFTSGQDKIDVSGAMKEAGIHALNVVTRFSGRPGEAVLGYNAYTREHSLAIDLHGTGKSDLFIRSHGVIKPTDIISHNANTPIIPKRTPLSVGITPNHPRQPLPPDNTPPAPKTGLQQAPFSLQNWSNASLKGTPMHTAARAVGTVREVTVMRDSWGYERVHHRSLGTGSLIDGGNSVLTNKHVHEALAKGSRLELWLGYEEGEGGRMKAARKVPLDKHLISGDARLDYAELRVDLPQAERTTLARQFPPLKLATHPQIKAGHKIFMPNHGQQSLGISFLNGSGKPATILGLSSDNAHQSAFYHDAYKIPGTSGSPVISADTGEIIALHNGAISGPLGGGRAWMGTASRIELIQQHRQEQKKQR